MPPEIKARSFENGETIEIGPNGQQVYVVAIDPDGDPVEFVWSFGRGDLISDAQPFDDGSLVNLAYDAELDGETLECEIFDEFNETLTLSWPLEVL
ncbi:MAG: hypothetical protein ACOZNI_20760 [Myxococcota bacterium]